MRLDPLKAWISIGVKENLQPSWKRQPAAPTDVEVSEDERQEFWVRRESGCVVGLSQGGPPGQHVVA